MAEMKFEYTVRRLKDGIPLTGEEIERTLLEEIAESDGTAREAIWSLAVLYSKTNRQGEAVECIKRLRALDLSDEEQAKCQLAIGQLQEQLGDYELAARFYREGLEIPGSPTDTQYWLNNNLGYSLIQLGRQAEALEPLEAAISVDSARSNAHKNMGLAHQRLGDHALAAQCFIRATQANASDPRSLKHLEDLIASHPELLTGPPGLGQILAACREAVAFAAAQQPDVSAHWKALRDKGRPH
jgi:tetratricopeptide (TPR) repeat protein